MCTLWLILTIWTASRQLNVRSMENVQFTSLGDQWQSYLAILPLSCTKRRIRGSYCHSCWLNGSNLSLQLLHGRRLFFRVWAAFNSDGITVDVSDVPDLHSSQEEADTRIILHCVYIAQTAEVTKTHVVVRSPDMNVFVLLLHFSPDIALQWREQQTMNCECQQHSVCRRSRSM